MNPGSVTIILAEKVIHRTTRGKHYDRADIATVLALWGNRKATPRRLLRPGAPFGSTVVANRATTLGAAGTTNTRLRVAPALVQCEPPAASLPPGAMSTDELADITAELTPPFAISKPTRQTSPLVFCSPHSGAVYTDAFLARSRLDPLTLRKSEDSFVDDLFRDVVQLGAPMIAARFPRAYLDVNREPFELDPALFEGPLPPFANTSSLRVASGLGTIARIVADGEDIYVSRFGVDVALMRIEMLYKPFHEALTALIEETRTRFGAAILIDCHSMPSASSQPASGPRAGMASCPR